MCGIAGIVSETEIANNEIQMITDAIKHRGPDAQAIYNAGKVAFGHNRLSIIDLDPRSNQPFFSSCGRYIIVYNGEVYNYKDLATELRDAQIQLRTTSDTEVIIEGFKTWGEGFVHKLNGMFAFAIYDQSDQRVFLYRDRVGKKPLYYFIDNNLFVFGSEIKAILKHPSLQKNIKIQKDVMSAFLQLGYVQEPKTFFENVYKFPAGHYATIDRNLNLSILPYWNVSHYIKTNRSISESSAFTQLKTIVTDAVRSRLIADVPVGIFLSGGIDSSLVTAVASQETRLKTFSIGFNEEKFDESVYAEKIARHCGAEHFRFMLKQQAAAEMIEEYLDHFDEPFADTSAIPTMIVSRLARQHVKVALTGDGGDELFLGYGSYTWAKRLSNPAIKTLSPMIAAVLKAIPSSRTRRASHLFRRVREGKQRRHIFSQEQYFFSDEEINGKLLADTSYYSDWEYDDLKYLKVLSDAERQSLFDFQFYLRDDLLVKVDRASMYYGLECRSPLLDHRLAEFAINLPENYRKLGMTTKYLLKKMLYELVPSSFFDRPKWGFGIPMSDWLKSDLSYLMDFISNENLEKTAVFNAEFVNELKRKFYNGDSYLYNRLWVLIIIQRFLLKHAR
jgi:asparagine synthase (glutamine-hydrolysing)